MANEFKHSTVGSQLSQTEYESTTGHVLDSQAAGDIIYASSTSQLSRLGIGTAGKVLAVNSGASAPEYVAALTGVTSVLNTALVVGRDADNDIDFATDNNIIFRAAGADQIKLIDGALAPVTNNDIDLGTSSLEFKDAFFDGTVTADAFAGPLTGNADTATALATGRTIGMTGDVVWTSASFTGAGNVTGSSTIQADAVESGMLNDNIISGQTEITSGLADADELLYSDGGVLKRVGLDTLTAHIQSGIGGDITGVTAGDGISGGGSSGDVSVAVDLATNSGLEISSNKLQIAKGISEHDVPQFTSGVADNDFLRVDGTVIEGRSASEVLSDIGAQASLTFGISNTNAVKIDAADVADDEYARFTANGLESRTAAEVAADIGPSVSDLHGAGVDGSANQLLTDDGDGTVTSESNLTFDGSTLTITGDLTPSGNVSLADAKQLRLGGSRMATAEPATNQTGYGTVVGFDSAGSVGLGDAVCINSSGKVAQANAQVGSTTDPAIGIATNAAASDGDDCYVLIHGIWRNDDETIDEGKPVYLGEGAGAVTKTRPSTDGDLIQVLGIGVGDGTFLVMPSLDVIEHA